MLQLFRTFMNSKVGVIITLAVLVIIALAFALGDVMSNGGPGGLSGGDRVAVVGDRKIGSDELEAAARSEFDNFREQNPTATMESFVAAGGLEDTVARMLDRSALSEFGSKYGLRAGGRLVDSEIVKIPAFAGADGKFDEDTYRGILRQRGLTDGQVREDFSSGLFVRQLITPVTVPGSMPQPLVKRYVALLRERRHGEIGLLLSDAFAPKGDPSEAQLNAFYKEHRAAYMRPERRVIRYATFGADTLKTIPQPTEAEIAARYNANSAIYSENEKRRLTQLVVPTDAAARAILAEVAKGKSLDAAAREKGLAVTTVGPIAKDALTSQASSAVAQAAFTTAQGKLSQPARGGLGYYIMRVDAVERSAGRSLAQVRGEIVGQLMIEKRNAAIIDLGARVEEEFDNGSSLADVAKELGLKIESTPDIVGNGAVYGKAGQTAPAVLAPAIKTAFDMDEGEPQLAEIEAGKTFLIFDVSRVTAASPAPLPEIRDVVVTSWRRAEGDKKAKAAADRVMKLVAKGESVASAMAKEGVTLPPPDKVNMDREQLKQLGQRVPPVLALMFSMAEGTVKRLEAPNDNGWFVVKLDDIEPGKLAANDPLIAAAARDLAPTLGQEYAEQFTHAAGKDVGVERNKEAIAALQKRLKGN
ncbi:MAG: ppiD [Proteobacteria bacterium]|nr:ppiD [Pseudomonadota bacterium]